MNKSDLVKAVSSKAELTKDQASAAVDAVTETIVESLKSKQGLQLKGFGVFSVQHRKARKGRNPATGAEISIAAQDLPKFKFSKEVKAEMN